MKPKELPPIETLRERFDYNPETGEFRWKKKVAQRTKVGDIAGSRDNKGYWTLRVNNVSYLAHRIAWAMHYGEDPYPHIVDHREGVEKGNAIANLRLATKSDNNYNMGLRPNNKSGHRGVHKHGDKWQAQLGSKYLGIYNCVEDAISARLKAEADNNIYICDR